MLKCYNFRESISLEETVTFKTFVSTILLVTLSSTALAATKQPTFTPDPWMPTLQEKWATEKKSPTTSKRKVASSQSFSESDLSDDYKNIRTEWLKVKTADQMEALLKTSYANFNTYSDDTKYFLAQAHLALPLRGIVWRMRPLFEKNNKFAGNKSTHVMAVQMLRGIAATLDMALPTDQADAGFAYLTEPSVDMTTTSQFKTIAEFQNFLTAELGKRLTESTAKIEALLEKNEGSIFVWDNKMQFGTGAFRDDIQRYIGHGAAEMNITLASMYKTMHSMFVFSAYNQDQLIEITGKLGAHLGQDSVTWFGKEKEDLGLTDEERIGVLRDAIVKKNFLTLRSLQSNPSYGANLMKQAYTALVNYVYYVDGAYQYLQGKDANPAMGLNPIDFSLESKTHLDKGVKNMLAVVKGVTEVRDPVSGKSVTVNLPAFYINPPKNLGDLMANKFEVGENEKILKNKMGETLKVRNYYKGRSIGWNNDVWKNYIPSAKGQSVNYMAEARRIMRYSLGTTMVMNLPAIFVR